MLSTLHIQLFVSAGYSCSFVLFTFVRWDAWDAFGENKGWREQKAGAVHANAAHSCPQMHTNVYIQPTSQI